MVRRDATTSSVGSSFARRMNANPVRFDDAKFPGPDEFRRQNVENSALRVGGCRPAESKENEAAWRGERRPAVEIAEILVERKHDAALSPRDLKYLTITHAAVILCHRNDVPPQFSQNSDDGARKILVGRPFTRRRSAKPFVPPPRRARRRRRLICLHA